MSIRKKGFSLVELLTVLFIIAIITSSLFAVLNHSKGMWVDGLFHLRQVGSLRNNSQTVFQELHYANSLYKVSSSSSANGYVFFYDRNWKSVELFLNSSYNQSLSSYGYNSLDSSDLLVSYNGSKPEKIHQNIQSFYVKSYTHDYYASDGFTSNNTYSLSSLYDNAQLAAISSFKFTIVLSQGNQTKSLEKLVDMLYQSN